MNCNKVLHEIKYFYQAEKGRKRQISDSQTDGEAAGG